MIGPNFRRIFLNIFKRYADTYLVLQGTSAPIVNHLGKQIGHIDRVQISGGRLCVSGWVLAPRVRLVLGGAEDEDTTHLLRPDVAGALGCEGNVGFDLSVPANSEIITSSDAPGLVILTRSDQQPISPISLPIRISRKKRCSLWLRFARDAALATPAIMGWYLTRNPLYRARVKARMRLSPRLTASTMETQLFRLNGKSLPAVRDQKITIVLPVYNAFDLVKECLTRVESNTDLSFRLIVIEDCSTDERVWPFLIDWSRDRDFVTLVRNPKNLGFIGSVNHGLQLALGHSGKDEGPVVLLNSDALVPQGWASRLVRPFESHQDVASVTPMSNDAEIMSVPVICKRTVLSPGQGDEIDQIAQRFAPDAQLTEVPTGVGFCMAMGRDWLARLRQLDTCFGRGYGEEVDWCQRIVAMGGRHLALPGLFVEHRGGESFGSAAKQALIAQNGQIISRRYPNFDRDVQEFIASDPLATARLALGLAWVGSIYGDKPVPVYLAHSLGGGADIYLEQRMKTALQNGLPSVVLRIGGKRRWGLELVTPQGRSQGQTDDFPFVARLLACLPHRRIIYSCGVGDRDPVELPELLLTLMQPRDSAELLFHDFFPLSPSYTLLDDDAVYRGVPDPLRSNRAHFSRRLDGSVVTLDQWQAAWRCFAERAELQVFSQDSARHVMAVWPDLANRVVVRPHDLPNKVTPVVISRDAVPVIGVLGNIGLQKGARVLNDLVRPTVEHPNAPNLVLIGNIDPAYALPPNVTQHGNYDVRDLKHLTRFYGITHWLIPSIWPETFCYTVHEALATGLPVMAFDIGAQGDAVRVSSNGIAIPFGDGHGLADKIRATIKQIQQEPLSRKLLPVLSIVS